jgi:hypothetical protein
MDPVRLLGAALAVNRIGYGAQLLVQPCEAQTSWIGRAARKPGTQVMIRSQAARDVALGLGALWALAGPGRGARAWFLAHALADAVDTGATLAARDRLPRRRARFALTVGGGSTAIALAAAARTDNPL